MIEALRNLYKNDKEVLEYLNVLDNYRISRHAVQYSGELSNELSAVQAIKDAGAVARLVKNRLR